jgi:hypothetical protein
MGSRISMSNNRAFFLFATLAALTAFPCPSGAQETPPAVAETPAAAPAAAPATDTALTVTDIIIDKTDKNAVMARDQAIIDAQRTAFQQLAEKSMPPEDFKAYKLPDDKTIATLVQDFEIKNEQISSDRYVAHFTVRFTPEIANYIKVPEGVTTVAATNAPVPVAVVPVGPRDVLVLPYFENIAGKKLLWEDPNPWREAWQASGNVKPSPDLTISVPTGDLNDISAGSTDAVWTGDYSAVEKLRANYNANEVDLTVANKSGISTKVDLYIYRDGKLTRQKSMTPYVKDEKSFKDAIAQVTEALKSPQPYEDETSAHPKDDVFKTSAETAAHSTPAPPEKIMLDATMNFDTFTQWLEVQRRLASISPIPTVEISSLSKNAAQFSIAYDGGMDTFKTALAGKGLTLNQPIVEVDESVLGSGKATKHTLYELRLLN